MKKVLALVVSLSLGVILPAAPAVADEPTEILSVRVLEDHKGSKTYLASSSSHDYVDVR